MAEFLGLPQPGETVTTRSEQLGPTTGSSRKSMGRGAALATKAWDEAEQAKLDAMAGPDRMPDLPSEADVAAQQASEANSAMATPKMDIPPPKVENADDAAMASTYKPQVDPDARYTSQEMSAAPDLQKAKTFAAQQDENARDEAVYRAKVAEQTAREQQRIAEQQKARQEEVQRQYLSAADDYAKNSHITSLWEDMSAPQRLLKAFAVAGGGFAARMTGSPNYAQEMLKTEMANDLERKKAKLDSSLERMRMAGEAPAKLQEYYQRAQTQLLALQKAQLDTFAAKSEQMLAPFGQAQQKVKAEMAGERDAHAEKFAKHLAEQTGETTTSSMEGGKLSETSGKSAGAVAGDATIGNGMRESNLRQSAQADINELIATGGLQDKYRSALENANERVNLAKERGKKGELGATVNAVGKFVGVIPSNALHELPPNQRELALKEHHVAESMVDAYGRGNMDPKQREEMIAQFTPPEGLSKAQRQDFWRRAKRQIEGGLAAAPKATARMEAAAGSGTPTAKGLTAAQINRIPDKDRGDFLRFRGKRNLTPGQDQFVKTIERLYGQQ